jgi:hypothetical protein
LLVAAGIDEVPSDYWEWIGPARAAARGTQYDNIGGNKEIQKKPAAAQKKATMKKPAAAQKKNTPSGASSSSSSASASPESSPRAAVKKVKKVISKKPSK